jgi:hypothetical protein
VFDPYMGSCEDSLLVGFIRHAWDSNA